MARLPRLYVAGLPQYVVHRTIVGQELAHDEADFAVLLGLLKDAVEENSVALHAYVLLPTAIHLLATPPNERSIPLTMQAVGRRYVRRLNARAGRAGSLWEGRYRSTLIEPAQYLLECMRFLESEPERLGEAASAEQYPWSSIQHHIGGAGQGWLRDHAAYWALGNTPFERQAAYARFVREPVALEVRSALVEAVRYGWALGSAKFLATLGTGANRRPHKLSPGRPRRVLSPKAGA